MKILVTNDDGVFAPGILAVASALVDAGHDVTVAAPSNNRSGSAASLGRIGGAIGVKRVELTGLGSTACYAVDAPPSMISLAFCNGSYGGYRPEMVVSGINNGHNTGRGILHSGTVGAALTASSLGIPAIAVSSGRLPESRFDTAAAVLRIALDTIGSWAGASAFNINVPNVSLAEIAGVRPAGRDGPALADIAYHQEPGGLRAALVENPGPFEPDSDSGLVTAGYVSVSTLVGVGTLSHAAHELAAGIQFGIESVVVSHR